MLLFGFAYRARFFSGFAANRFRNFSFASMTLRMRGSADWSHPTRIEVVVNT